MNDDVHRDGRLAQVRGLFLALNPFTFVGVWIAAMTLVIAVCGAVAFIHERDLAAHYCDYGHTYPNYLGHHCTTRNVIYDGDGWH